MVDAPVLVSAEPVSAPHMAGRAQGSDAVGVDIVGEAEQGLGGGYVPPLEDIADGPLLDAGVDGRLNLRRLHAFRRVRQGAVKGPILDPEQVPRAPGHALPLLPMLSN